MLNIDFEKFVNNFITLLQVFALIALLLVSSAFVFL